MPVFYDCQRCAACCRWPGHVKLSEAEINRIAAFLGSSEFDFIQQYTRLRADRRGLALQDKTNGECIFLDGFNCRIQPVKPQQCRDFPNLWRNPGFEAFCQAVKREVSEDDYRRLIAESTGREPQDGSLGGG